MRGAYAVGVLRALHDYVGSAAFDTIVAVSSGVFAASYFLAGQVEHMENTWRDLVCGRQLISYRNFFRGRPVLNLDYLIGLFQNEVRLEVNRLVNASTRLIFVTTHYATGQPVYLDARRRDIFDLMCASAAIPRLYPLPVQVDGVPCYDGGHSDPIPVAHAIACGCRKILTILTRPASYRKPPASRLVGHVLVRYKGNHEARRQWMRYGHHQYNQALDLLAHPPAGVALYTIAPTVSLVTRLTRDRDTLIGAIEQGKRDARAFLAHSGSLLFSKPA